MDGAGRERSRLLGSHAGRPLVAAVLGAYFLTLAALGGREAWDELGVPYLTPSFADMRSVTSAWECDRQGIAVLPTNPCDPYGARPANYPTIWLWPSGLGLGQGATVPLGVLTAAAFLGSFLVLIGRSAVRDGPLYAAAAISPAVMLGVERANVDLLLFAMLVTALAIFRRSRLGRGAGYSLLLLAAVLKLFPVFAWGVLLRQSRRLVLWSGLLMVALFAVYVVATFDTIQTIEQVVWQVIPVSYGADVGVDSVQSFSADKGSLDWLEGMGDWLTGVCVLAGAAAIGLISWRRRALGVSLSRRAEGRELHFDAFVAGAGIYVASFALWHNWDYRLIFLLLALPQLIAWARISPSPVPAPRLTLAALFGTLWLSEPLTANVGFWVAPFDFLTLESLNLSLDEVCNWFLFVALGTGLAVATLPSLTDLLRGLRTRRPEGEAIA